MNLRHVKGLLRTIAYTIGIAYGTLLSFQSYAQSTYIVLTVYIVVMALASVTYARYMVKCMRGREPYEKPMEECGE